MRVALGAFSLASFPFLVPGMRPHWPMLLAYLLSAIAFQVLISKGIGGVWRVLAGGVVDVYFITFLLHQLGSMSSPLAAVYLLIGIFNAMVAPPFAARLLGGFAALSYASVVFLETTGVLPYAPALPSSAGFEINNAVAMTSSLYVGVLIVVSTLVSERIFVALHRREAALKEANAALQQLSQRDPLTQLYNRRYFVQRVEQELERVRRGHGAALLMIDLDGFKHINDERGHLAGDELLRRAAGTIQACTRAVDVCGRFGGDEFVVVLTDTESAQATVVAERLVSELRRLGREFDPHRPVTASIGIALARPQDDVVVLLNTADEAAYRAKQQGRDRYCMQAPERNSAQFESGPRAAKTG